MGKPILYESHMEFEHQQWKREIMFWEEEIKSFNHRLSQLRSYWKNKEGLFPIEYYQKKFMLQAHITEDLLMSIDIHESQASSQDDVDTIMLDTQMSKGHIEFRKRMKTQRDLYDELKRNTYRFFDKYV